MVQSNPALLQGNKLSQADDGSGIIIPSRSVAILFSGYGVEGVYTKAEELAVGVQALREFGAYRNEPLSVKVVAVDSLPI